MEKEQLNIFDKDLLLKDLCARLPYKLVCEVKFKEYGEYKTFDMFLDGIFNDEAYFISKEGSIYSNDYKPYLFPLSSMIIEQRCELHDLIHNLNVLAINREVGDWVISSSEIDWYNKNHFDYRGLIEKGLALDATGLNIY